MLSSNGNSKIKNSYEIIKELETGLYLCEKRKKKYRIRTFEKSRIDVPIFLKRAGMLASIKIENLNPMYALEDVNYIYLCGEVPCYLKSMNRDNLEYLVKNVLEIAKTLKVLHAKGYYHGYLNEKTVKVDVSDRVIILDFGLAYFHGLVDSNSNIYKGLYGSMPKITDIQKGIETDIKDLARLFLTVLNDRSDGISHKYIDEYLRGLENNNVLPTDLCLLIVDILDSNSREIPKLSNVIERLTKVYRELKRIYTYEVTVLSGQVRHYCGSQGISEIEFEDDIKERIGKTHPYVMAIELSDGKKEIRLAFLDILFKCSLKSSDCLDNHLFCFKISYNAKEIDEVRQKGELLYDSFVFANTYPSGDYDSVASLKDRLSDKLEEEKVINKQNMSLLDKEAKYLKATENWIESEKNTKPVKIVEHNRGQETLIVYLLGHIKSRLKLKESVYSKEELINALLKDSDLYGKAFESIDSEACPLDNLQVLYENDVFRSRSNQICSALLKRMTPLAINERQLERSLLDKPALERYVTIFCGLYHSFIEKTEAEEKVFSKGRAVKLRARKQDEELSGELGKTDSRNKRIVIKIKGSDSRKEFDKKLVYELSRDCEVEEMVLRKEQRAVDDLQKNNTACHSLLAKMTNPRTLNHYEDLFEPNAWFNPNLDNNQKLAVKKALSLESGSDLLLIQGPPGTGKTTVITEILRQYLRENPHDKVLVVSQSNQAVDNVLEKVCNDIKIMRIGREDEDGSTKMSEIARNYTPNKVLDSIIHNNLKRIKSSLVPKELEKLQINFAEALQGLSNSIYNKNKVQKIKTQNDSLQDNTNSEHKPETPESSINIDNKNDADSRMGEFFMKHIRVIFGTLIGISGYKDFRNMEFGLAIVDEAGRALLCELLVPLVKSKKIILVGDQRQLAPVVKDELVPFLNDVGLSEEEAGGSFFGRFYDRMQEAGKGNLYHFLNQNYRSHHRICSLYSDAFYEGRLETPKHLERSHGLEEKYKSSVIFLSTSRLPESGKSASQDKSGEMNGWYNLNHIKIIEEELKILGKLLRKKRLNKSIGIITPYRLQANKLKSGLKDVANNLSDCCEIYIGTVDSFQGSDRDYIIYDSVRSGTAGSNISFIADEKRLNVSLSRAKQLLLIVGDSEFLYKAKANGLNPFKSILKKIYEDKSNCLVELNSKGRE